MIMSASLLKNIELKRSSLVELSKEDTMALTRWVVQELLFSQNKIEKTLKELSIICSKEKEESDKK
jgi:hypothetical protein